jgi:hypothetical protein
MKIIAVLILASSLFAQSFGPPPVTAFAGCAKDAPILERLKKTLVNDFSNLAERAGLNRVRASVRFKRGRVSTEKLPSTSSSFGLVPSLTITPNKEWIFGLAEAEPSALKCDYRYELFLTIRGIDNEGKKVSLRTPGKIINLSAPAIYSIK